MKKIHIRVFTSEIFGNVHLQLKMLLNRVSDLFALGTFGEIKSCNHEEGGGTFPV